MKGAASVLQETGAGIGLADKTEYADDIDPNMRRDATPGQAL